MKRTPGLTLVCFGLAFAPARATLDVSFGASVPVGDDANLFFSISSRYFDRDVRVVEDWGRRYYPNPDDLSVALFLDRYCGKGPEFYFGLRREGLGWFEISNRCRVSPDVFFVPVARDPGPPYGKAYGYWKKHKQNQDTHGHDGTVCLYGRLQASSIKSQISTNLQFFKRFGFDFCHLSEI